MRESALGLMRIIAGRFKGRRLQGPTGPGVRPTSDRLRETLFNVLQGRIEGARVFDAFAGTGAVGLEALSRGAERVTFVEQDVRTVRLLRTNIALCGVEDACAIIRDGFLGLDTRYPGLGRFDLVYLDPPYDVDSLELVVSEGAHRVGPDGMLILEHSRRRVPPESMPGIVRRRMLPAGDSALAFYAPVTLDPD